MTIKQPDYRERRRREQEHRRSGAAGIHGLKSQKQLRRKVRQQMVYERKRVFA